MNHSPEQDQISAALAAFQGDIEPIKRNATNAVHGSGYATLDAIWAHIRPKLKEHGLFVLQLPGTPGMGIKMTLATRVGHKSGQWIEHEGTFPLDSQNPQSAASAITYLSRYSLQTALGIPSLVDDDGNGAAGKAPPATPQEAADTPAAVDDAPEEVHGPEMGILAGFLKTRTIESLTPEELEDLYKELLLPAVQGENWARAIVVTGKNANKFLGMLDDDSMSGYEKVFCPAYLNPFIKEWRVWKDAQNAKEKPVKPSGKKGMSRPEEVKPEPVKRESVLGPDGIALSTDFFDVPVPSGTNAGKRVEELSKEDIARYEAEWIPKIRAKIEAGEEAPFKDVATEKFYFALLDFKHWREYSPALPMDGKPVDETNAFERAKIKPEPPKLTNEQQEAQDKLKAKPIAKRPGAATSPAKAPASSAALKAAPEKERPATANPDARAGQEWRAYAIPIGKPQSEGGNKGLPLGDVSLEVAKNIKAQYLDKQQWDKPDTLKPFAYALKAAVEACIANDGKPPEVVKPALPEGPVADLYARLDGFAIDPEGEWFKKAKLLKLLPATCMEFARIRPEEAQAFLDDWENTVKTFEEADIPWDTDGGDANDGGDGHA